AAGGGPAGWGWSTSPPRNFYPPLLVGRVAARSGAGEALPEFTNPRSTKWALRCITKWRRTGRVHRDTTGRNLRLVKRSLELNQARRKMNLAPARAPLWAVPACAAAGSRDGRKSAVMPGLMPGIPDFETQITKAVHVPHHTP